MTNEQFSKLNPALTLVEALDLPEVVKDYIHMCRDDGKGQPDYLGRKLDPARAALVSGLLALKVSDVMQWQVELNELRRRRFEERQGLQTPAP